MAALHESEVFGGRERIARRQQALGAGFVGPVEEHHRVFQGAAGLHGGAEGFGRVVRHADADEDDGELAGLAAAQARALRDLGGHLVVG